MAGDTLRNKPCWCDSGKKYKHCHMNRSEENLPTLQEANSFFKRSQKKYCLHPNAPAGNCSGNIVRAHTIQRNGGLSRIARNGHVGTFYQSFGSSIANKGQIVMRQMGLKQASTFTGFCSYHDKTTFSPVEDQQLTFTAQQLCLLGYRALCKEVYAKKMQAEVIGFVKSEGDKGKSLVQQIKLQDTMGELQEGNAAAIRDLEESKIKHDRILTNRDYSFVRGLVAFTDNVPSTLVSGVCFPEIDFDGNTLCDLEKINDHLGTMSVVSIPADTGGAFILQWLTPFSEAQTFAKSFESISQKDQADAILRFVYTFFENTFFSLDWWDSLVPDSQAIISERAKRNASTDAEELRIDDDGARLADFKVVKVIRIGW